MVIHTLRTRVKLRHIVSAMMALLCLSTSAAQANDDAALLNPLFQDHAILQRDHINPVWGQAKPGEALKITFAGKDIQTHADAKGHWEASLPALSAGGPYTLAVSADDGTTQTIQDILIGDDPYGK